MLVDVTPAAGEKLDLHGAINQAADVMWDRIIPRSARARLTAANATRLVMRAIPSNGNFEIEFQPTRVWQYLDAQQLPVIRTEPSFNLQVQMENEYGARMPESESALQAQAHILAGQWGIALNEQAPSLILDWQWLGPNQVQLNIRGNSRFPEQTETRTLTDADPMTSLQAWLQDVLLRARDAYAETAGSEPVSVPVAHPTGTELIVRVQRQATLPEQVLIEDALRDDRRVALLEPLYLSSGEREYRIRLAATDDRWMPEWFAQRGMTATPTPYGWLVQ